MPEMAWGFLFYPVSMTFHSQERGFTLIELLVVIAIIGILSSIVLASLNTARQKSRDARRVADIRQLQLAAQLYYDANGSYPTSTAALAPTYIATIPGDPIGTVAYPYDQGVNGTTYHLGANLEDGSNASLSSDSDTTTTNVTGTDTTDCAGSSSTARYCYDVVP